MTELVHEKPMMGMWLTTGLVVGSMIGSGIFMLPVSLAPLGVNAIFGWLLSIAGALAIAFAFSRLTRLGGGGIQSYIEQSFGPFTGFLAAWALWVGNWVSVAAVAISFAAALSRVSPLLGAGSIIPVAIAAIVALTALNARGVKVSGEVNLVTIAVKLLPLFGVVVLIAVRAATNGPIEQIAATPVTTGNLATAASLTLFAMLGFENATAPVGKVRDPERTLPRAILGGTMMVGVIYLLASTGVTLLLPEAIAAASPAPYADVYAATGGEPLAVAAALAIAIGGFGTLNCTVLVTGELGYSLALRGQFPSLLARTTAIGTPVIAQVAGSVLAIIAVLANASRSTAGLFTFLILLVTSAALVVYLIATLAAARIDRGARTRLVLALALLFIAFSFYGAGAEANLWCIALLAVGAIDYVVMRWFNGRSPIPATEPAPVAPAE
ncbi:MAG: amino acid permease [Sphingomicrobium sp.]